MASRKDHCTLDRVQELAEHVSVVSQLPTSADHAGDGGDHTLLGVSPLPDGIPARSQVSVRAPSLVHTQIVAGSSTA